MEEITNEKLPQEFKKKWVDALRSGEYQQGKGYLMYRGGSNKKDEYCCLGVACVIAGIEPEKLWKDDPDEGETLYELPCYLPKKYMNLLPDMLIDKQDEIVTKLTYMNDAFDEWANNQQSFEQIANWIERNM